MFVIEKLRNTATQSSKLTNLTQSNKKIFIYIYGDNNHIVINKGCLVNGILTIRVGQNSATLGKVNNVNVQIGENVGFGETRILTYNSNSNIKIGNNCMFAFNVWLYHTDAHPIYDVNTNQIINRVKTLSIGDKCWIGANASILKNVHLPNNTIVGWGSVVTGKFEQENTVIAGNPSKVIKTGVYWDKDGSKGYVQNIF